MTPREHTIKAVKAHIHNRDIAPRTFNAFVDAITSGRLSLDREADNHADRFIFMGAKDGKDEFLNIGTCEYIE